MRLKHSESGAYHRLRIASKGWRSDAQTEDDPAAAERSMAAVGRGRNAQGTGE